MSLVDTDKVNDDRSSPNPLTHDTSFISTAPIINAPRQAHKTISSHYTTDADTIPGRLQMQNKQIIANDGTTPVGLFGYNKAMNIWGLFQTKPGTDVTTNTDTSKFIFNSNQDVFKIITTGTLTVSLVGTLASGANSTVSSPHGFNFLPGVFGFLNGTGSGVLASGAYYQTPLLVPGSYGGIWQPGVSFWLTADATNVNAIVTNNTSVGIAGIGTCVFKYFLLQESAS